MIFPSCLSRTVVAFLLLAAVPPMFAQSLTVDEVDRRMKPVAGSEFLEKGFVLDPRAPVAAQQTEQRQPVTQPQPAPHQAAVPTTRAGDFNEITFEFGTARLTPNGARALAVFRKWMSRPQVAGARITIVGHTDAVGSDESNMRLSQERAQAVVSALIRGGIDSRQLEAYGKGKREPLMPDRPANAANRRVQIIATMA